MANPRKPTSLKVVAGTDQPCRRPEVAPVELPLASEVPDAPDWLLAPYADAATLINAQGRVSVGMLPPATAAGSPRS